MEEVEDTDRSDTGFCSGSSLSPFPLFFFFDQTKAFRFVVFFKILKKQFHLFFKIGFQL